MGDEKSPEEPKIPDDLGVIPSSQPAQNGVEPNETEKAASRQDSHSPPTDPSMNSSPLHKSVMIVGSGENDAGSSSDENSASRPTSPSGTSAESENGRPRTSTLVDRHRRIRKNSVIRVALGGYSGDTATDVHRKMTNKANLRLLTKVVDGQHPNGDVSASSTSPSLPDSSHGELAVDTPLNLVGYPHLTQPNFESSPLVLSSAASTASLGGLARSESTASMFGDNFIYANSNFSVPPSTASVLLSQTSPYSSLRKTRSDSQPDDYYLYRKANVVRDEAWEQENLRQPGGFTAHFAAKHLNTEQFIAKHGYKTKLAKYQGYMDRAFAMVQAGANTIALQGMEMLAKVMARAWSDPKFGHDLAYDLCEYINVNGYLDFLLKKYTEEENEDVELAAGAALEECFSAPNREKVVRGEYLEKLIRHFDKVVNGESMRISLSILESLFKHSVDACTKVIELGGLDHVLKACKTCTNAKTMRHAALALSNLAMFGGNENHPQLISRNVPEWLFLLASLQDEITRYYACLAICMLVSNPEIESAVVKSGTLGLVEPFLLNHKPDEFAASSDDYKHQQGRPKEWLERLLPLFTSKRREARSLVAYHFVMEASIKKQQDKLDMFTSIGSIPLLKELASSPDELPSKYATIALQIIGETIPYKLSEDVPLWSVEDVKFWVTKIGFAEFEEKFAEQMVDGDLLLLMSEEELKDDIGITSSLLRKRFVRELKALKISADYGCVDESRLDKFMMSICPDFSIYTYRMLEAGVNRQLLPRLTDEMLKTDCRIKNSIHRMKILEALEDVRHIEDMEIAVLRKHVDVFISYRRSTGSQLASLLRVLLQLRGYKVFIDVDRLYAGQFDSSLLMNIKAAKHFVLVLTPQSLDRCIGDSSCNDWVHKEVKCALEHNRNIIPVLAPNFEWPNENVLPEDMRAIMKFNSIIWVHEYQEACVDKVDKFVKGELNVQRQNSQAGGQRGPAKFSSGSASTTNASPPATSANSLSNQNNTSPDLLHSTAAGGLCGLHANSEGHSQLQQATMPIASNASLTRTNSSVGR